MPSPFPQAPRRARHQPDQPNGAGTGAPPSSAGSPPDSAALRTGAQTVVRWLVAAWLAWLGVLMLELVLYADTWPRGSDFPYLVSLTGRLTLLGSAGLCLPHAAWLTAERLGVRGWLAALALAGLLLLYPSWDVAHFLTLGDSIATSELRWPVRLGVLALGLIAGASLWIWHTLAVERLHAAPRVRWFVWLAGAVALLGLLHLLSRELRAYAYLARALLLVAWLLSGSLVFAGLRRAPLWAVLLLLPAAGLTLAWGQLTPESARPRNRLLRKSELVALTDVNVRRRDPHAASFDISLPERFDCSAYQNARGPVDQHAPSDAQAPTPDGPHAGNGHGTEPQHAPLRPGEPSGGDGAPAGGSRRIRNVILISFDALRADSVGRARPAPTKPDSPPPPARKPLLMPNLTAFAHASRYYARAVTTYPATLMAVGGALTGLSASDIMFAPRRPDNLFRRTRDAVDSQLITLPKSGWFSLPIIDALFVQGTRLARFATATRQTSWLIGQLRTLKRREQSVLAWIHYFEPHKPYVKHPGLDFGDSPKALYDSELAYVDRQFGRLMRYLRNHEWLQDTLVVLFSDHGQALGEREYLGHHVYLNSWITDIPIMIAAPGQAPRVSTALADITDVAPTVLDALGVPYEESAMAGRSLLAEAPHAGRRYSFAEAFPIRGHELFDITNQPITSMASLNERMTRVQSAARNYLPKVSVVTPDRRLIVNRVTGATELYDRVNDRQEQHDLSAEEPQTRRRLLAALSAWTQRQSERLYCSVKRAIGTAETPP